jgi:GTPase SAR1 family protein
MSDEILILGAESSGKTVFIRRLLEISTNINASSIIASDLSIPTQLDLSAIPTVGVDITKIALSSDKSFVFREIGSALASKYDVYLPQAQAIIYLIDAADIGSAASAMILLYEILSYKQYLCNKSLAIVMNKTDLCDHSLTIKQMIGLEAIIKRNHGTIRMIEYCGSSADYEMPTKVFEWLCSLARPQSI